MGPDPAFYAVHYRFLETPTSRSPTTPTTASRRARAAGRSTGSDLPDEVLRQVYRDNARRLIAFD